MSEWLLFDPLFRIPFLTGFVLAAALSLMGSFLRMRDEWLAALGLSQLAAAGAILATAFHLPVLLGAGGAAGLAMVIRASLSRVGNSHYALFILVGWSATLLIGSYVDHGQRVAESLLRGQLYFARTHHLVGGMALLALAVGFLPWLSPRLLRDRFFPDFHAANRIAVWPHRIAFALLTVAATVAGTVTMGAFPTFAMLFVPPWIACVLVNGWRWSVVASMLLGVGLYTLAFALAIPLDLPFGPVLIAVLALGSGLRCTANRRGPF